VGDGRTGAGRGRLHRDYAPVLLAHLARRDEQGLRAAYELGRRAMVSGVGLLDVAAVHQVVLDEVLRTARDARDAQEIVAAAGEFLLEALAAFEIARRGYLEATLQRGAPHPHGAPPSA
jgi:hypothetical protein